MALSTWWWLAAGVAVAAELASGTVYLLLIAVGLAAGALAAHAGLAPPMQTVVAAVVAASLVLVWRSVRARRPGPAPARANRDVNLDIGETVQVPHWRADGTAEVRHRGATWSAVAAPGAQGAPGAYRIVEVVGSQLVVAPQ